jgi:hypothetical protein
MSFLAAPVPEPDLTDDEEDEEPQADIPQQALSQSGRLYPERPSFPPEILIKIFSLLDDPTTATCFSLVNHKCQKIFEDEAPKVFPRAGFPISMGTKAEYPSGSTFTPRLALRTWVPEHSSWDPFVNKYVEPEALKGRMKNIKWDANVDREDKEDERVRREHRAKRQERRKARAKEKQAGGKKGKMQTQKTKKQMGLDEILQNQRSDDGCDGDDDGQDEKSNDEYGGDDDSENGESIGIGNESGDEQDDDSERGSGADEDTDTDQSERYDFPSWSDHDSDDDYDTEDDDDDDGA